MKRAQGRGEALRLDRERHVRSGEIVFSHPVIVEKRRARMRDGPAHDAGKEEPIRLCHRVRLRSTACWADHPRGYTLLERAMESRHVPAKGDRQWRTIC